MTEEERTELARERTWLSYARTSMSFLVAGVALLKFFPGDVPVDVLSALLIVLSVMFAYRSYKHLPKPHLPKPNMGSLSYRLRGKWKE